MLTYMKKTYRSAYPFPAATLAPKSVKCDYETGFITSIETLFPTTSIELCQTHLSSSVNRNLARIAGVTSIPANSKLNDIYFVWCGSAYLNIATSARHDVTLKNYIIELASQEYDEARMSRFMDFLNLYFNKNGVFRMQRYARALHLFYLIVEIESIFVFDWC